MYRFVLRLALTVLAANGLGCAICYSPYDNDYATYGTKFPRADMAHGRVGSPFSDPGIRSANLDDDQPELIEMDSLNAEPLETVP